MLLHYQGEPVTITSLTFRIPSSGAEQRLADEEFDAMTTAHIHRCPFGLGGYHEDGEHQWTCSGDTCRKRETELCDDHMCDGLRRGASPRPWEPDITQLVDPDDFAFD